MDRLVSAGRSLSRFVGVLCGCLLMSASGCAVSTKVTPTERSSIEQQLLTRSLERAIAQIDVRKFTGKTLTVDLYGLTNDRL